MRAIGRALSAILDFFIRLLLLIVLPVLLLVAVTCAVEVDLRQAELRDAVVRLEQLTDAAAAGATSITRIDPGQNTDIGSAMVAVAAERQSAILRIRRGDDTAGDAFLERMRRIRADLIGDGGAHSTDQAAADRATVADSSENDDEAAWLAAVIDVASWMVYAALYVLNAALLLPAALNSELTLLLGMAGAAMLGALIIGARRQEIRYLRAIMAGIAAALFMYLLLWVLRTLVIIELTGDALYTNPYAATFLALLAGLCADRILNVSAIMADAAYVRLTYSREDAAAEWAARRKRRRKIAKQRRRAREREEPRSQSRVVEREVRVVEPAATADDGPPPLPIGH